MIYNIKFIVVPLSKIYDNYTMRYSDNYILIYGTSQFKKGEYDFFPTERQIANIEISRSCPYIYSIAGEGRSEDGNNYLILSGEII